MPRPLPRAQFSLLTDQQRMELLQRLFYMAEVFADEADTFFRGDPDMYPTARERLENLLANYFPNERYESS